MLIPCASQGSPTPVTNWFQILNQNNSVSNSLSSSLQSSLTSGLSSSLTSGLTSGLSNNYQDNRIKIGIDGSKDRIYQWNTNLVIRDVSLEDSGKYICVVSNSVGEDNIETDLLVKGMMINFLNKMNFFNKKFFIFVYVHFISLYNLDTILYCSKLLRLEHNIVQ